MKLSDELREYARANRGRNEQSTPEAKLADRAADLLDEAERRMSRCLAMLDALNAESGRGIEWGEEDAFRMGEWFEADDLAAMGEARATLTKLRGQA